MLVSRHAAAATLSAFIGLAAIGAACAQDPTIPYRSADREMSAAIAEARKAMPRFVDIFSKRDGDRFTVKVAIPVQGTNDHEHIWMSLDAVDGDAFKGRIANEPERLPALRRGSAYRATRAMISDWGYWRDGLRYGNYTTRVMLSRISRADADELRRTMSPEP